MAKALSSLAVTVIEILRTPGRCTVLWRSCCHVNLVPVFWEHNFNLEIEINKFISQTHHITSHTDNNLVISVVSTTTKKIAIKWLYYTKRSHCRIANGSRDAANLGWRLGADATPSVGDIDSICVLLREASEVMGYCVHCRKWMGLLGDGQARDRKHENNKLNL
ncbi:hypothetical protein CEXT_802751 [Caerostris extrusa]|uniref:Uncharacterized protein n=1 Tax=Caerostris extrusa TaxID=172846 RepID=A0AAV4UT35_CAEEX|nr:hypothetical protein CEXT_802751 [Caerostris extrusa]